MTIALERPRNLRGRLQTQAPESARSVIVRGLTAFVLVWQALWFAADPGLWPNHQQTALAMIATGTVVLAWLAFLLAQVIGGARPARIAGSVNVVAACLAAVVLLAITASTKGDLSAPANMVVLAVGLAGLTWDLRPALVAIVTLIACEAGCVSLTTDDLSTYASSPVLVPTFAAVVAVISTMARFLLVRAADGTDAAVEATWVAVQERRKVEALEAAANQQERLVHDTVLNTLTAVERGGLESTDETRQRLYARCREGAQILRSVSGMNTTDEISHPSNVVNAEVDGVIVDLMASGVFLTTQADSLSHLPEEVYQAINIVNLEALRNVHRHAHATRVHAQISLDPGPPVRVVDEVIDDGVGFDPKSVRGRLGIERSIKQSMLDVGGQAEVISSPGNGTTVRATWVGTADNARSLVTLAPVFAIPVLGAIGLYAALVVAFAFRSGQAGVADLMAFALFLGLGTVLLIAALRSAVTWWTVGVVALLSPLIAVLQLGQVEYPDDVDWFSVAVNSLFLVAIALGPRYSWLVLIPVWLLLQGDPGQEVLSSGTAVLVAGALFSRSFRRNVERFDAEMRARDHERIQAGMAQARVRRSRRRYRALRASGAISLLDDIADGSKDPADPATRAQAAMEERYIRTILRVNPAADHLHAVVTSLAMKARDRGVVLDVNLSDSTGIRPDEIDLARPSWVSAVLCATSGEVARFTAQREGDRLVARLVVPIAEGERGAMSKLDVPGVLVDPTDPTDRLMMWETAFEYEVRRDA